MKLPGVVRVMADHCVSEQRINRLFKLSRGSANELYARMPLWV